MDKQMTEKEIIAIGKIAVQPFFCVPTNCSRFIMCIYLMGLITEGEI